MIYLEYFINWVLGDYSPFKLSEFPVHYTEDSFEAQDESLNGGQE